MALIDAPVYVPKGIDTQYLLDMAKLCEMTYTGVPQGGPRKYEPITINPRFILFQGPDNKRVLAFRGSATFADWVHDFDILPCLWHGMWVSRGFLGAYKEIASLLSETKPDAVTGHSLGGADATYAALDLGATELITFGSPKPGLKALQQTICNSQHLKATRVVHSLDIVPTAPPFPYVHVVPDPCVVNDDGTLGDHGSLVITRDMDQLKADFSGKAEAQHLISNYIQALSRATQAAIK